MKSSRGILIYIPGIISLVLIPIFCIPFLKKSTSKESYVVLDYYPTYGSLPLRDYKTDSYTLIEFRNLSRRISQEKDTINGIHLLMPENSKYSDFISFVNALKMDKSSNYYIDKSGIWTFYLMPVKWDITKPFEIPYGAAINQPQKSFDHVQIPSQAIILDDSFVSLLMCGYFILIWASLLKQLKINEHKPIAFDWVKRMSNK